MLADAEKGQIARVLVYKYDQLGRTSETHVAVADLEDLGVEVISVTEGRESLTRGIQLMIADHYSRALSERTRDGHTKRFEQGYWTGGKPPMGYKIVEVEQSGTQSTRRPLRKIVVDEYRAEQVRTLFQLYDREGYGYRALGDELTRRGVKPPQCNHWTQPTIRKILQHEIYTGLVRFRRSRKRISRRTGNKTSKPVPEDQQLARHDESLRIISDGMFQRVQARIHSRSGRNHVPRAARQIRPLTQVIWCGCCGQLYYCTQSRAKEKSYRYYECGTRQRLGGHRCTNKTRLREDLLVEQITHMFKGIFADPNTVIAEALAEAEKLVNSNREEADKLRKELEELGQRRDQNIRCLGDADLPNTAKDAIGDQLGEIQARRDVLQKRLSELTDEANHNTEQLAGAIRQAFAEAQESFENITTTAQMNDFVQRFVGPLEVQADGSLLPKNPQDGKEKAPAGAEAGLPTKTPPAGFEPATK